MLAHAYEYIAATAKYRNISKAAAALYITQPALSKYIDRVENDLGMLLFDRTVNPIALTPAGKRFLETACTILDLEHALMTDLEKYLDHPRGKLAVGFTPEFCSMVLPYLLPFFNKYYPAIELQIKQDKNKGLLNQLVDGQIELLIAASIPTTHDNLKTEPLTTDPIVLAVPADHPVSMMYDLSENSPISPYYLNPVHIVGAEFVVCTADIGMGMLSNDMFNRHHLSPHIVLEVEKHETALRMASTGLGMIFTPVTTPLRIKLIKPMAFFSIENPVYLRARNIYYLKKKKLSCPAQCFIKTLSLLLHSERALMPPQCRILSNPSEK